MQEVLFALAAIANIASFALMLWQEYKHRRDAAAKCHSHGIA